MTAPSQSPAADAVTAARRLLGPKGFRQSEDEWHHDAETVARALLSEHDRLTEEVARLRQVLLTVSMHATDIHAGRQQLLNEIAATVRAALPKEPT